MKESLYPVSGSKELLRFTATSESDSLKKGWVSTDIDYSNGLATFNGSTSKVDTGSDMIGVKAVTIVARIKPNSYAGVDNARLIDNGRFIFSIWDIDRLRFTGDGWTTHISSAYNSISLNTWYHVVVTRNSAGDETNFYINGVLSGSANQDSGTPTAGTSNVIIGNKADQSKTFDGDIDFVRVIDGVWTAKDVELDYKGMLYQPVQNAVVGTTDLLDGWDFTDGWTTSNATINSATNFTADAINGYIIAPTTLVAGKRYRMHIAGAVSSGQFKVRPDGDSTNYLIASGTFDETFDFTSITTGFRFLCDGDGATSDITSLTIKEVSDGCIGRWDLSRDSQTTDTDLVDGWDFTNWDDYAGGSAVDATSFVSDADGGGISKSNIFTISKKYRVIVSGTNTGGTFKIYFGSIGPNRIISANASFSNVSVEGIPNGTGTLYLRNIGNVQTTALTKLKVYEIKAGDTSGQKNNGSITPGSSTGFVKDQNGEMGLAYDFDGSDTKIDLGNSLSVPVSGFSVSAWIKPLNMARGGIVSRTDTYTNKESWGMFSYTNNGVYFRLGDGTNFASISKANVILLNTWALITCTYDGTDAVLYVNAIEEGREQISDIVMSSDNIVIGNEYSTANLFNGSISKVRIFNYALTPTQIRQMYLREGGRL